MKVAIMGFGVVGSGVAEVITGGGEAMAHRAGEPLEIAHILDLRDFPDSEFKCFTKNFDDILNDPEVDIVAEVMGGTKPAYDFTKRLLLAGKHVVTSNKELVAKHGTELLAIAKEHNVNYLFEASVGGGIPIIRPLHSCLAANDLTEITGILNGTTNYILTQMIDEGQSFETALKGAQENGYAEKDPTADIEGFDTCRKIAILASLAFGKSVDSDKIPTEGITKISLADIAYAESINCEIKLLGMTCKEETGVFARVCPVMIPSDNPLAGIDDVFNGILVKGDAIGDVMFYGRGAGKLPTASAVVADIIDIVKHKDKNIRFEWSESTDGYLLNPNTQKYKYYIRLQAPNAASATVPGGFKKLTLDGEKYQKEFAVITPLMTEPEVQELLGGELSAYSALGKIRLLPE